MTMKLLFIFIILTTVFTSCAQSKITATKSYGFLRQNSRGTIPVDENNKPLISGPDSQYVAYVELPSTLSPSFSKAWINQQTFDIFASKVNSPFVVGAKQNSDEVIKLSAQSGNSLWQLNLQKGEKEAIPSKYTSVDFTNNILIKGTMNKQETFLSIPAIIKLSPIIFP